MFSVFLSSVLTFLSVLLEVQWVGYTIKLDKPHLARPFPSPDPLLQGIQLTGAFISCYLH